MLFRSVEVKLIGARGKDFPKIMIATNKENKSTVVAFQSHGVGAWQKVRVCKKTKVAESERRMNDRELLELAARAAGLKQSHHASWAKNTSNQLWVDASGQAIKFNPLADDGDAFRLAVQLSMDIHQVTYGKELYAFVVSDSIQTLEPLKPYDADPYAATRRAITRAAAAIAQIKAQGGTP